MKNRKLPFGYALHGGEIVINQCEANAVGDIFRLYTGGTSLSGITEMLKSSEISYDAGRLWNKNMVSRILGDRRYVESTVYPQIISESIFSAASSLRSEKAPATDKSEAQRLIQKISGCSTDAEIECQILSILNRLSSFPETITARTESTPAASPALAEQLESIMMVQPIDENRAQRTIYEIAEDQYAQVNNSQYETEKLRRFFKQMGYISELTPDIIRKSVSQIEVRRKAVTLILKNGQAVSNENLV